MYIHHASLNIEIKRNQIPWVLRDVGMENRYGEPSIYEQAEMNTPNQYYTFTWALAQMKTTRPQALFQISQYILIYLYTQL